MFAVLAALSSLPLFAAIDGKVKVDGGTVVGMPVFWSWGVWSFRGIPYAAPPVGNLRWKPPQPAAPWQGVRMADQFGPACMQVSRAVKHTPGKDDGAVDWWDGLSVMSEDCLYLNVWTAAKTPTDRLPVVVWIHGGANRDGAGSDLGYDLAKLAKRGVVAISVNYRVNVFGFLAHPELTKESEHHSSGNYAYLDQIAAMKWVKNNIAGFGGDPGNITVFGESAGASAVSVHVRSPLSKGLFQHAIADSGGNAGRWSPLAEVEQAGVKFAESVGAHSLAELRKKPAAELVKLDSPAAANVDGWVIPQGGMTTYELGQQNDVPLLLGANAADVPNTPSVTAASAKADAKALYGDMADDYLKLYPADSDAQAQKSIFLFLRDRMFWSMKTWALLQSKTGKNKAYLFHFTHVAPAPEGALYSNCSTCGFDAFHSSELIYVLNNLHLRDWPWTDVDRKVSDTVQSYWVNFIKTGNPNGPGLPEWPAYDAKTDLVLKIGDTPHVDTAPYAAGVKFLDALNARQQQAAAKSAK